MNSQERSSRGKAAGPIRSMPVVKVAPGIRPMSLSSLKSRENSLREEGGAGDSAHTKKTVRQPVDSVGLKQLLQDALSGNSSEGERKQEKVSESKSIKPGDAVKF